ncbi:Carboxypeptidase B [Folsomia candida]|uniref:Carboxypeptidase B n=1 Tax=Folsomia candida TaxID=158441 RepID=A0A226E127_FOLCA|nr:Carboxypeptidase B [Folsomia candida]
MMGMTWIFVVVGVLASTTSAVPYPGDFLPTPKSYSGYSLLRTEPLLREDLARSLLILDGMRGIHFWKYPLVNRSSDILTSPAQLEHIQALLATLGVSHDVIIDDVKDLLAKENDVGVNGYSALEEELERANYAKTLASQDSRVTYENIGSSSEGKEIGLVKISSGGGNKPAIWIDGGMHAREWISPATATYIMSKLTNKEPASESLLSSFDFYIVPIINVDGYEWTHTGDRMWRKTRSRNNGRCIGVDPNRNWGFHWAEQGSSTDPCSDIYHGPRAFSEPETLSVARAIKARPNIKLYLTFHSYSQLWLVPYGYARNTRPVDYNELVRLAQVGKNALSATYGTSYRLGTAPDLLYPAAGGSDDWAKGSAGIKYAYCLELRDTGRYGFLLPSNQIVPTGEETFNGLAAMAKELHRTLKKQQTRPVGGPYVNADKELNSPSGGEAEYKL